MLRWFGRMYCSVLSSRGQSTRVKSDIKMNDASLLQIVSECFVSLAAKSPFFIASKN